MRISIFMKPSGILFSFLLLINNLNAQYIKAYNDAKDFEKKGEYYKAIQRYNIANICSDKQVPNDIQERIDNCASQLNKLLIQFKQEKEKAEKAQKKTQELTRIMQTNSLNRMRNDLNNNNLLNNLVDCLLSPSPIVDSIYLLNLKANIFFTLGDSDKFVQTLSIVHNIDSLNLDYRRLSAISYMGEPEKTISNANYILNVRPNDYLTRTNKALSLCQTGKFKEAVEEIKTAISTFYFDPGKYFFCSTVNPEIQNTIYLSNIYVDCYSFETFLYYLLASINTFAGNKEFITYLDSADKKRPSQIAYFYTINYAWKQLDYRPFDYGAYIIIGSLWEKASYPDHAINAYRKFIKKHRENKDPRYNGLSDWVNERINYLVKNNSPSDLIISDNSQNIPELYFVQSENFEYQKIYDKALKSINEAIKYDPQNVVYLLKRIEINGWLGNYNDINDDCNKVIKTSKNPQTAYFFRAFALWNLNLTANENAIETDLKSVLKLDPYDFDAINYYSYLLIDKADRLSKHEDRMPFLSEALELLKRAKQITTQDKSIDDRINKIENLMKN